MSVNLNLNIDGFIDIHRLTSSRKSSHSWRDPIHPLHRRPLGEVHGLHLRHVLPSVLVRQQAPVQRVQLWYREAGGGGGVHQAHLGAGHILRQREGRHLPQSHHGKPVLENISKWGRAQEHQVRKPFFAENTCRKHE